MVTTRLALIRPVPLEGETAYVASLDGIQLLARSVGDACSAEQLQALRRRRLEISMRPHPALVSLIGTRQREDGVWLLESEPDLIPLDVLWSRVRSTLPDPIACVREVATAICAGLSALHGWRTHRSAPVLHGAIRPGVVGVRRTGELRLGRFAMGAPLVSAAQAYRPPEAVVGAPLDQAGELYAVGATLLHLLVDGVPRTHLERLAQLDQVEGCEVVQQGLSALLDTDPERRTERSIRWGRALVAAAGVTSDACPPVEALVPTPRDHAEWMGQASKERSLSEIVMDFDDEAPTVFSPGGWPDELAQGSQGVPDATETPDTDVGYWDAVDEESVEASYLEPQETLVPPEELVREDPPEPPAEASPSSNLGWAVVGLVVVFIVVAVVASSFTL